VRQIFAFDRFAGFAKFAVLTPYKCAKFYRNTFEIFSARYANSLRLKHALAEYKIS